MSVPLDEDVVQQVNDAGSTPWSGTVHRYTAAEYEPLSGEGAYKFGGRWNPRRIFPTIYLARPLSASMGELRRLAEATSVDPQALLRRGYVLHDIEVVDLPVLDLRTPAALAFVGLSVDDIADDDWAACQSVGHAAWFLEYAGVLAPSATGDGHVLAAFEHRIQPGQIAVLESRPLDLETYLRHCPPA